MSQSLTIGVVNDAILRLARKAGIARVSSLLYDGVRTEMGEYLEELLQKVIIFTENGRRNTIKEQDVINALRELGIDQVGLPLKGRCPIYNDRWLTRGAHHDFTQRGGSNEDASDDDDLESNDLYEQVGGQKKYKYHPGTVARREIRYYQKKNNCLIFPKAPFERKVRDIAMNYMANLRITQPGILLIQSSTESHLLKLLQAAALIAHETGHKTVDAKHLILAKKVREQ